MLGSILLRGSAPLIIIGVLLLATNAGTAYFTHKLDSAALDRYKAQQAAQAAADNAKALAQLQAHEEAANKAVKEAREVAALRAAEVQSLRKAIAHAPKTRACVDSPAIRALVDGLRRPGTDKRN